MSGPWVGVLLLAVPAQIELPVQQRGDMQARLEIREHGQATTPGLAEVVCTLTIEGPLGVDAEPAQLADPLGAWRAESVRFCRREGDRVTLVEVLELKQIKPGQQDLKELTVRFRRGPDAPEEEAKWTDLLKPRDVLLPDLPALPPVRAGSAWLWPTVIGGAMVLGLAAFVGVRLLTRPRTLPSPTPEQWALGELARLEEQGGRQDSEGYHTRLSDIVRRFLEEKYGLQAPRQTTAEFLASAREADQLSDQQRELLSQLLQRCDLAKFAPVQVAPEDCRLTTELARTLVTS